MKNKLFKKRLKEAFYTLINNAINISLLWLFIIVTVLFIPMIFIPFLIISFFTTLFPESIFWGKMREMLDIPISLMNKILASI